MVRDRLPQPPHPTPPYFLIQRATAHRIGTAAPRHVPLILRPGHNETHEQQTDQGPASPSCVASQFARRTDWCVARPRDGGSSWSPRNCRRTACPIRTGDCAPFRPPSSPTHPVQAAALTPIAIVFLVVGISLVLRAVVIVTMSGRGRFPFDPWICLLVGFASILAGQSMLD